MPRFALLLGSFFAVLLSGNVASAQTEDPGPDIDSFQHEIDSANAWYNGAGTAYTFSMADVYRSFGDPINNPNEFGVIPGEDILDNDMLGEVLAQAGLNYDGASATVYDTTYFACYGYVFERQARYDCWRKDCDSVDIDGDVFANVPLYRVLETTLIWKHDDPSVDSPWRIRNYYYAVPDSGTHLTSTLSYWSVIGLMGWNHAKFLQNARSINTYKVSSQRSIPDLVISPIPADEQIRVAVGGIKNPQERISLQIMDLNGKVMWQADNMPAPTGMSIDVSVLLPGVYIIRATSPSGTAVKRFNILR
jgi:hypothetical protein